MMVCKYMEKLVELVKISWLMKISYIYPLYFHCTFTVIQILSNSGDVYDGRFYVRGIDAGWNWRGKHDIEPERIVFKEAGKKLLQSVLSSERIIFYIFEHV